MENSGRIHLLAEIDLSSNHFADTAELELRDRLVKAMALVKSEVLDLAWAKWTSPFSSLMSEQDATN